MPGWSEWLIALAVIMAIVPLIGWGGKHAKGGAGGIAMALGLAFGHLFDPPRAEATEELQKRRESGKQEAEAGELRPPAD